MSRSSLFTSVRLTDYAFEARVAFLFEKLERAVSEYSEVSLAEEKVAIVQKYLQRAQLRWDAGKYGA